MSAKNQKQQQEGHHQQHNKIRPGRPAVRYYSKQYPNYIHNNTAVQPAGANIDTQLFFFHIRRGGQTSIHDSSERIYLEVFDGRRGDWKRRQSGIIHTAVPTLVSMYDSSSDDENRRGSPRSAGSTKARFFGSLASLVYCILRNDRVRVSTVSCTVLLYLCIIQSFAVDQHQFSGYICQMFCLVSRGSCLEVQKKICQPETDFHHNTCVRKRWRRERREREEGGLSPILLVVCIICMICFCLPSPLAHKGPQQTAHIFYVKAFFSAVFFAFRPQQKKMRYLLVGLNL